MSAAKELLEMRLKYEQTDIVIRLWEAEAMAKARNDGYEWRLCHEAADDITHLRAERDEARKQLAGLREEIASGLDAEASMTPCEEDAKVVRACAALVRANFSYDNADAARALAEGKDAETKKPSADEPAGLKG